MPKVVLCTVNIVNVIKCHDKGIINVGIARVQRAENVENAYLVNGIGVLRRMEVKEVMAGYHAGQGQLSHVHLSTEVVSVSVMEPVGK